MADTGDMISRIYCNFRGVDFRGEEINLVRSPDSLNVWKDYKETESIRTRPETKLNVPLSDPVYGIFFFRGVLYVHSGVNLYKVVNGAKTSIYGGMNRAASQSFVFDDVLYIKDGKNYLQYDGETVEQVVGYVPVTSIGRKPTSDGTPAGGETHEDVNMLSPYRMNTFLANEEGLDFYLDTPNIDRDFKPIVRVDGELVNNYTVNYEKGVISFTKAPSAPLTDGQDNVVIEFKKTNQEYHDAIMGATILQTFDNRVFFSGNEDYPGVVWHSSLNDPSYISDTDYYRDGVDAARIKGMVAGNNALWVFREPSDANTNVFYHTPTIDSEYGKIYPSSHSSITIGCVGKAINFNDDIVFFSSRGMEGISGDITTEQVVAHRSSLVDRKMLPEADYENMILEEWEGYLLVFIGNKVFLADSRTKFTYENHFEYEWFYWELKEKVICARVYDGVLYLGTADGVYTLNDFTSDVESYWVTPKDKFNSPHKLKTTNKRGCVVESTGDISVYAKTEKTDFELIGTYENITDSFVSRIKRKKFKDIQLKFHSKTRFSLETATLECFIGGYIKR